MLFIDIKLRGVLLKALNCFDTEQYLLVYGQIETISSHQILRPDFETDFSNNITNIMCEF